MRAELDEVGYGLTADFSAIDSTYQSGEEQMDDNGDRSYTVRYRVHPNNTNGDGQYSIRITASDRARNESRCEPISLYLDNTPPLYLSSTTADRPRYRNGEVINLEARLDASGYRVIADFGSIDSLYDPTGVTVEDWGMNGEDDDEDGRIDEDDEQGRYRVSYRIHENNTAQLGEFRVTLSASDEAGNIATDSIYLELDNIPPDAISIERPSNGDAIRRDLTIFTIHDEETPDEDVESFVLQIRSPQVRYFDAPQQSPGHWNSGGSSSITWDATTVVEKIYDFQVVVTDEAGNVFITSSVTVEVDGTPPPPPFNLLAVGEHEEGVTLVWRTSTPQDDTHRWKIYRSTDQEEFGICIMDVPAEAAEVYTHVDATVEADQIYYYIVTAEDRAGNESQGSNRASPW